MDSEGSATPIASGRCWEQCCTTCAAEATTDSIGSRRVDSSRLSTQSENSDGRTEDEEEEHEEEDEEEDIPRFRV